MLESIKGLPSWEWFFSLKRFLYFSFKSLRLLYSDPISRNLCNGSSLGNCSSEINQPVGSDSLMFLFPFFSILPLSSFTMSSKAFCLAVADRGGWTLFIQNGIIDLIEMLLANLRYVSSGVLMFILTSFWSLRNLCRPIHIGWTDVSFWPGMATTQRCRVHIRWQNSRLDTNQKQEPRGQCQSKLAWAERGRSVASLDEKSIPLFQQFTRSDPPDGDDVCPISLIAAPGRGPAVRAWHRHLSWDGAVLVEQVRPDVCHEDERKMSSS